MPPKPVKTRDETRAIVRTLEGQHPNADTELHYTTPYELLVATILSAQCTDERVNQVTPALFRRYPNAGVLAKATTEELEPQIQSTGFFRMKSKALVGMANAVVERHHGEIPASMQLLTELPGVGRKTANVVLGHALGVPGLPVDRHVLRVANRIGIARSDDPVVVEQQLTTALPPDQWTRTSDTLILHGRRICKPRPLCDRCAVRDDCEYYRTVIGPSQRKQARRDAAATGRDRAAARSSNTAATGRDGAAARSSNAAATGRDAAAARSSNAAATGRDRVAARSSNAAATGRVARPKKT
jgi:endonuclease-3